MLRAVEPSASQSAARCVIAYVMALHFISMFLRTQLCLPQSDGFTAWYVLVRIQKTATSSIVHGLLTNFENAAKTSHDRVCLGLDQAKSAWSENKSSCQRVHASVCKYSYKPLSIAYCDASPLNSFQCNELQDSWRHVVVDKACNTGVLINPHMSMSSLHVISTKMQIRTRFLVMLRDPIERVMSEFMSTVVIGRKVMAFKPLLYRSKPYFGFQGQWEYEDVHFGTNYTLDTWMQCMLCSIGWNNRQVRMLGLDTRQGSTFRDDLLAPVGKAAYARAENNLDMMMFVGVVERFAESWELLAATFSRVGLPVDRQIPQQMNMAKHPHIQLNVEQRRRLVEANQFDIRLYKRGLARLSSDLALARAEHII